MIRTIILINFISITCFALHNKYCQLSCDYVVEIFPHTVCNRENEKCGPGPQCGPDFQILHLKDSHRRYIVDLHNFLRNKVAVGNETRGSQPPATNMKMMSYNKELEFIAQCWANTCSGNPLNHDSCRRTAEFDHVGQNLGYVNSSDATFTSLYPHIKNLVMLWYNEVKDFRNEWIPYTQDQGDSAVVGHYTQMLWADTSEIGCAITYYTTELLGTKWHQIVLVCNYGPGGNYLGLPLYDIGKPCSKCPSESPQNLHYKGLCGHGNRDIPVENYNFFEL